MREDMAKALKKLADNNLDPLMVNISISADVSLSGWLRISEPDDYINKYLIELELYLDENFQTKIKIGQAYCYYFSGFDWANEGFIDIVDAADAISGDVLSAIVPVTDKVGRVLDAYMGCNILYIDEFNIKPEYRNKGIGTLVFPLILDILGKDAGIITIIPAPTDSEGKRINVMDSRYEKTYIKMCRFIMDFGFFNIDRENKVWAKDTTLKD